MSSGGALVIVWVMLPIVLLLVVARTSRALTTHRACCDVPACVPDDSIPPSTELTFDVELISFS